MTGPGVPAPSYRPSARDFRQSPPTHSTRTVAATGTSHRYPERRDGNAAADRPPGRWGISGGDRHRHLQPGLRAFPDQRRRRSSRHPGQRGRACRAVPCRRRRLRPGADRLPAAAAAVVSRVRRGASPGRHADGGPGGHRRTDRAGRTGPPPGGGNPAHRPGAGAGAVGRAAADAGDGRTEKLEQPHLPGQPVLGAVAAAVRLAGVAHARHTACTRRAADARRHRLPAQRVRRAVDSRLRHYRAVQLRHAAASLGEIGSGLWLALFAARASDAAPPRHATVLS